MFQGVERLTHSSYAAPQPTTWPYTIAGRHPIVLGEDDKILFAAQAHHEQGIFSSCSNRDKNMKLLSTKEHAIGKSPTLKYESSTRSSRRVGSGIAKNEVHNMYQNLRRESNPLVHNFAFYTETTIMSQSQREYQHSKKNSQRTASNEGEAELVNTSGVSSFDFQKDDRLPIYRKNNESKFQKDSYHENHIENPDVHNFFGQDLNNLGIDVPHDFVGPRDFIRITDKIADEYSHLFPGSKENIKLAKERYREKVENLSQYSQAEQDVKRQDQIRTDFERPHELSSALHSRATDFGSPSNILTNHTVTNTTTQATSDLRSTIGDPEARSETLQRLKRKYCRQ